MYQPIEQFVCHGFWIYVLKKSVVFLTAFYFADYLKSNQKWPKNGFYQVIMNIWVMRITKILLSGQLLPFKWLKFNLNSFSPFSEILVGPKSYLHLPAAEIVKRTTLNSCYCTWVFTHTLGNSLLKYMSFGKIPDWNDMNSYGHVIDLLI